MAWRRRFHSSRWLTIGAPLAAITLCIVFTTIFFNLISEPNQDRGTWSCQPDGAIQFPWLHVDAKTTLWDSSLFLDITLGFGRLTFAEAKALDIAWDLVVGRGGQVLLVVMAYPIFRRTLRLCLESPSRGVPIDTFAAVAFSRISLDSARRIARDFGTSCRVRNPDLEDIPAVERSDRSASGRNFWRWEWRWISKGRARISSCSWPLRFLGLMLVSIYILAFPTFLSAMTGYQTSAIAYILNPDDPESLFKASKLIQNNFVVYDGSRIGLTDNLTIAYQETPELYDVLSNYSMEAMSFVDRQTCLSEPNCESRNDLPSYALPPGSPFSFELAPLKPGEASPNSSVWDFEYYQNRTLSNITLQGKLWTLQPPPLEAFDLEYVCSNGDTGYVNAVTYSIGNTTISCSWIEQPGHNFCLPSNKYQWGFSSLMLLTFCIITIVFASVLAALHWDAEWHGRTNHQSHYVSTYRDALDLSAELRTQLGDDDVEQMSAKDIEEKVKQHKGFMRVEVGHLSLSRSERYQGRFRRRRVATSEHGDPEAHLIEELGVGSCGLKPGPGVVGESVELSPALSKQGDSAEQIAVDGRHDGNVSSASSAIESLIRQPHDTQAGL